MCSTTLDIVQIAFGHLPGRVLAFTSDDRSITCETDDVEFVNSLGCLNRDFTIEIPRIRRVAVVPISPKTDSACPTTERKTEQSGWSADRSFFVFPVRFAERFLVHLPVRRFGDLVLEFDRFRVFVVGEAVVGE